MTAYEDRYVAFIDILGFKDLIDRLEKNPETLGHLAEVLAGTGEISRVKKSFRDNGIDENALRVSSFSDNIVISAPYDAWGFSFLIMFVSGMCNDLLNQGLLTRGGISKGKLIHTDGAVLGSGLIKAYELESKFANYPRILIDDCIRNSPELAGGHKFLSNILLQDFDGLYHLHIFARSMLHFAAGIRDKSQELPPDYLEKGRLEIVRSITENKNPSVKAKATWLANYYNRFAAAAKLSNIEIPDPR